MTSGQAKVYAIIPGEGQASCYCNFPLLVWIFGCNPFHTAFFSFMAPCVQILFYEVAWFVLLWLVPVLVSDGYFLLITWLLQDLLETPEEKKGLLCVWPRQLAGGGGVRMHGPHDFSL